MISTIIPKLTKVPETDFPQEKAKAETLDLLVGTILECLLGAVLFKIRSSTRKK